MREIIGVLMFIFLCPALMLLYKLSVDAMNRSSYSDAIILAYALCGAIECTAVIFGAYILVRYGNQADESD